MSTGLRKGVFLLLLLSHLASAQLNAVDHRPSRFSAQIAHHTELPYIRDPPEPQNGVGGPLPDYHTSASPINGDDTRASTTELQTNNEANDIHAADGLSVPGPLLLPGPSDSGSPAASLKLTSSTRSETSAPSGLPFRPMQYGMLHEWFKHTRKPAHFGFYMAVDAGRVPAGVSRLITPYLPGYPNSHVCLNLTYALIGPGAERIQVVAQDVGNRPLFSLEQYPQPSWRTFAINMTVHQDLRFFIEAYTNGKPGWVAIDDFKYTFNTCP
ncbi:uncharacterized protein LOC142556998 isoform X4 [Dermacentor variabilis]|uniref:uncharacterized protein LOC142556998 isoform X4 n=1 Tax=Dermacentor variabilis TaxID=34621 RepID=UPI003F5C7754